MAKRVIIAGATGFIGRALCRRLHADYEVIALSRDAKRAAGIVGEYAKVREWDARTASAWAAEAEGAYAIINLAGENLSDGRWRQSKRDTIIQSRTNSAGAIVDAVAGARNKPAVVIQGSAVGYYGSRNEEVLHEDSPSGAGFLAEVCRKVEAIGARIDRAGVRFVAIRTGLVLGREGGALPKLAAPFRFFVGGYVGNGKQWLSWISLDDEITAIRFLMEDSNLRGPYNLTAPHPVTMRRFAGILGQALRRPAWTRLPGFAIRFALGQMADEVLLASQRAIPKKLLDAGFAFHYPDLRTALEKEFSERKDDHESG